MSKEKISIYVNQKSSTKIDICLSESIQELRFRLEILIPNALKFMKEGTILNEQQEKDLIIKDIKRQLDMIQVRGEEYGWSDVKKKEIKHKNVITTNKTEKESDKNKKEKKKN